MGVKATGTFEVTGWEQAAYDEEPADGPKLSRATVGKSFRGDLTGESSAELLMAQSESGDGLAYTALERVVGRLGGREGTFVLQHGAGAEEGATSSLGYVVRGSGMGGLRDLHGEVRIFVGPDGGHAYELDYDFG